MLNNMLASDFVAWQKFAMLEPFGAKAEEVHLAILCTQVANYFRPKNKPDYEIQDFMLTAVEKTQQRQKSVEELYKLFGSE
ncbi:MAG: hypothetical protein MK214_14970 [Thalassotalea sp.]|nr:hypothetical protein [Thalassotalea sp.]